MRSGVESLTDVRETVFLEEFPIAAMVVENTANLVGTLLDIVAANAAWLFVTPLAASVSAGTLGATRPKMNSSAGERATLRPAV